MSDTILIEAINQERTRELRSAGCRRCVRTRARWVNSEYRRVRRRA